jgi:hypothetical protein
MPLQAELRHAFTWTFHELLFSVQRTTCPLLSPGISDLISISIIFRVFGARSQMQALFHEQHIVGDIFELARTLLQAARHLAIDCLGLESGAEVSL